MLATKAWRFSDGTFVPPSVPQNKMTKSGVRRLPFPVSTRFAPYLKKTLLEGRDKPFRDRSMSVRILQPHLAHQLTQSMHGEREPFSSSGCTPPRHPVAEMDSEQCRHFMRDEDPQDQCLRGRRHNPSFRRSKFKCSGRIPGSEIDLQTLAPLSSTLRQMTWSNPPWPCFYTSLK